MDYSGLLSKQKRIQEAMERVERELAELHKAVARVRQDNSAESWRMLQERIHGMANALQAATGGSEVLMQEWKIIKSRGEGH